MDIEKSLLLLNYLSTFSKDHPQFFDVNHVSGFLTYPYNQHVKIVTTCCLNELCFRNEEKFACTRNLLEVVSSNVFSDDTILSMCSVYFLIVLKRKSSDRERVLAFIHDCFKKLVEKVFNLSHTLSLFYPLNFIIECINVESTQEVSIFVPLFCNWGYNIVSTDESPGQSKEFQYFIDYCKELLFKFGDDLSPLEPFFDDFFSFCLFLFNTDEYDREGPLYLITKFEHFIYKVICYILAKKNRCLLAASFLNEYLLEMRDQIGKENMDAIRILISSCDDRMIKSRFTLFYST